MGNLVGWIQARGFQEMLYRAGCVALLQESSAQSDTGFYKFGMFGDGAREIFAGSVVAALFPQDFAQLIGRVGIARRDGELFFEALRAWSMGSGSREESMRARPRR